METITEYINQLDGRGYSCLYRTFYDEELHAMAVEMVPGSLRWEENGD